MAKEVLANAITENNVRAIVKDFIVVLLFKYPWYESPEWFFNYNVKLRVLLGTMQYIIP